MKREILIFISNIVILFSVCGIIINFSPYVGGAVIGIAGGLDKVSKPYDEAQQTLAKISPFIPEQNDNNTNAASEESQQVMNSIDSKDSFDNADLTVIPDDIKALMAEEEKVIEEQEVKGKTSEANYTGGGNIVSFGSVQIQSKIPESFYELNIENLLNEGANLKIKDASKPTVLIYHSHTTECFTLLDVGYYTSSTDLKTKDIERNMVRVGDEICRVLEQRGIGVVHDREIHDEEYNGAYDSSRQSVEKYLEEYPSIEITIDVHRDSITYKDGTKVKPTVEVNGKKAAKMMIISGCEYNRVKNFPDWQENLHFSAAVTNQLNSKYDGLMRPILFSERKYNMDLTKNSFLLEVGTEANTLDEACYSGRLFADGLADLLLNNYVEKD